MKGTKKQVAWASEIVATLNAIFDDMSAMFEADPNAPKEAKDVAMARLEEQRNRVNGAECASDIISLFRYIKRTDNPMDGASALCAVYRVRLPETDGQRKILGK